MIRLSCPKTNTSDPDIVEGDIGDNFTWFWSSSVLRVNKKYYTNESVLSIIHIATPQFVAARQPTEF